MTRPIVESFTRKGWNVNHGEMAFGVFENRGDIRGYKPYELLPSCSIAHILRSRCFYLSPGVKRLDSKPTLYLTYNLKYGMISCFFVLAALATGAAAETFSGTAKYHEAWAGTACGGE